MVVADMNVLQMIAPPGTKPLSVFYKDTAVTTAAGAAVVMLYVIKVYDFLTKCPWLLIFSSFMNYVLGVHWVPQNHPIVPHMRETCPRE